MNTGTEPSEFLSVAYRIRAAERRKSVAHGVSRVKYTHLIMLNAWAEQTPLLGKGGVDALKKYPRSLERRGRGGSFKLQNNLS